MALLWIISTLLACSILLTACAIWQDRGKPAGQTGQTGDKTGQSDPPATSAPPDATQPGAPGQPPDGGTQTGPGDSGPPGDGSQTPPDDGSGTPSSAPPGIVLGYYTEDEPPLPGSRRTVASHSDQITFVAHFWYRYRAQGDGRIEPWGNFRPEQAAPALRAARNGGVRSLALIHNMLYGNLKTNRTVASAILNDPEIKERAIKELVALVEREGFDGVNLDLEYVLPSDRDAYSRFVADLKEALGPQRIVVVSVQGTDRDDRDSAWSGAHDYRAIGKAADYVQVMAYQEHGPGGPPGSIAGLAWLERVARYTRANVPPEKVLWGIAAYGFDWNVDTRKADYIDYRTAVARARANGATLRWHEPSGSPYFHYRAGGKQREVWYEDARSMLLKTELAMRHGFAGIAIWRLGMEDPAFWEGLPEVMRAVRMD